MGWRNWNFYEGDITQSIIEANMDAMADRSRGNVSLLDLGYTRAGLDDNWQACGTGVNDGFHAKDGTPLVNKSRFPDMKAMVNHGHVLGLHVGWYDNNCICGEHHEDATQVALDVSGDVAFVAAMGFDGLKADGCGPGRDLPALARQLNQTGRQVLLENCHYYKWPNSSLPPGAQPDPRGINRMWPYWKDNVTGGELVCQEHTFRTSNDIRNSWSSWFGNLATLAAYQDPVHPISQPGCWAYADMLMVGVFANPHAPSAGPALSVTEWKSHFGAWTINSSPLIRSFDLTNQTTMDSVWPFIANKRAIEVNQAWAGHPGRELPQSVAGEYSVWTKPLLNASFALLLVSMRTAGATDAELDVAAVEPACAHAPCDATDVWTGAAAGASAVGLYSLKGVAPHDSVFLRFTVREST